MTPETKPKQPTKEYCVFDDGLLVFESDHLMEAIKFINERKSGVIFAQLKTRR